MLISGSENFISGMSEIAASNVNEGVVQQTGDKLGNAQTVEEQKAALKEFESLFIGQLMKLMFKTVEKGELFNGGYAEETFNDFLVDGYGDLLAENGGIGITEKLQKSLFDFQNIEADSRASAVSTVEATKAYEKIYNF